MPSRDPGEERLLRQQILHERRSTDRLPTSVDGLAVRAVGQQLGAPLLLVDAEQIAACVLRVERPQQRLAEAQPLGADRNRSRPHRLDELADLVGGKAQGSRPVGECQAAIRNANSVDRAGRDHRDHAVVTLHRGGLGTVEPGDAEAQRQQLVDSGLGRRRLTEGRQHLADVAEEHGIRTHDEHAVARQALPMLVEQERGPVEADRGLARPRSALHDEATFERGADDRVLLGLDRGDDVAHLAGTGPTQLGEQRVRDTAGSGHRVGIGEVLVEEVLQLAAAEHVSTAALEPERVGERRPVEGRRHLGPPVNDHGRAVVVLHVAATDVPAITGLMVDAAETQRTGVVGKRGEPALELPLHGNRVGFVRGQDSLVGDLGRGPSSHRFEAALREPQTGALRRHIWVGHDKKLPASSLVSR